MSRAAEQLYPVAVGLLTGLIGALYMRHFGVPDRLRELFGAVLTLTSLTTGFLITSSCTLLTVQETNSIIRRARKAGAYLLLVEYVISGARWNFFAAVASAIALLTNPPAPAPWHGFVAGAWFALIAVAVLTIVRIFQILAQIMRANADPSAD